MHQLCAELKSLGCNISDSFDIVNVPSENEFFPHILESLKHLSVKKRFLRRLQ